MLREVREVRQRLGSCAGPTRRGIPEFLSIRKNPRRQLVLAMIAARILDPLSKLATAQKLDDETLSGSLSEVLDVGGADAKVSWLSRVRLRCKQRKLSSPEFATHVVGRKKLGRGAVVQVEW